VGSAPCDWEAGYTDPLSGHYLKFSQVFAEERPAAVVFAFTGNPGLEARSTGCINSSGRYSLSALLANYKSSLTQVATYASDHGAQVYFSASPPRNPATPACVYKGTGGSTQYGFNGVSAINRLYQELTQPAEYVSTSALTWRSTERCMP
jgi:hypothetical protein